MNLIKTIIMLSIFSTFFSSCSLFGINSEKEATYSLILKDGDFQLREYKKLYIVSTPMESKNSSFKKLFNYISGENKTSEKISMTTPVFMDKKEDDTKEEKMSFVLPASYNLETAPLPTNSEVELIDYSNSKFAVFSWNGSFNEDELPTLKENLKNWANKNNYKTINDFKLASFNPPWTIPAFRKYELLLEVIE